MQNLILSFNGRPPEGNRSIQILSALIEILGAEFSLDAMRTERIIAPAFLSLSGVSLLGCVTRQPAAETVTWEPIRTYSGACKPGWEFSDFTASGSTERGA